MYQHVLVATDGSELSLRAVETAATLASQLSATLSICHVRIPYEAMVRLPFFSPTALFLPDAQTYHFESLTQAQATVAPALAVAARLGLTAQVLQREHEQTWLGILEAADAAGADLLVMASHGRRGLSSVLLGSETQKVLAHTTRPVLVVH